MPTKSESGRKRYIAFKIKSSHTVSRKELIAAIRKSMPDKSSWERAKPWLTVFEENMGILRCAHNGKDEAVELLASIKTIGSRKIPVVVETLGTSGTIKRAKKKYLPNLIEK